MSKHKVVEQLHDIIRDIKDTECALLGNLYKLKDQCPKEIKTNIERIARKIRSKSLSAECKLKVLNEHITCDENMVSSQTKEIEKLTIQIQTLSDEKKCLERELTSIKKAKENEEKTFLDLKTKLEECQSQLALSSEAMSSLLEDSFSDDAKDGGAENKSEHVPNDKNDCEKNSSNAASLNTPDMVDKQHCKKEKEESTLSAKKNVTKGTKKRKSDNK